MQRVTISIDEALAENLDRMAKARHYQSRSEAVRDLVREGMEQWRLEAAGGGQSVASLSYIVDARVRTLPQRIAAMRHASHDLVRASTTVPLDHFHSFETIILAGATHDVRAFAEKLRAERGVRSGAINLLSVTPGRHQHGPHDHDHAGHGHLSPS